jgi:hypothetical protein
LLLVFIFMVIGRDAPDFKTINNRVMVDGEAVFVL